MKTSRKGRRLGSVLFFIPIIAIGAVVLVVFINAALAPKFGTLDLRTQAAPYRGTSQQLTAQATVDGKSVSSPAQVTLPPGTHLVVFGGLQGYRTPSNAYAYVQAGQTSYSTGVYEPFKALIAVTNQSFVSENATGVAILHGVTPVVWINRSDRPLAIQSNVFGPTSIPPGGNFTYIFPSQLTCRFWIFGNNGVGGQFPVS